MNGWLCWGGLTGTDPVKESQTRHLLKHLWAVTSESHLYSECEQTKLSQLTHRATRLHERAHRLKHKQTWAHLHKHATAKHYGAEMNRCTFGRVRERLLQWPLWACLLYRKRGVIPAELCLCCRLESGIFKCHVATYTTLHFPFAFSSICEKERMISVFIVDGEVNGFCVLNTNEKPFHLLSRCGLFIFISHKIDVDFICDNSVFYKRFYLFLLSWRDAK